MTSEEIEQEMRSYYNERAGEYDQLYAGKVAATQQDVSLYVEDATAISRMAAGFGDGHLIDLRYCFQRVAVCLLPWTP